MLCFVGMFYPLHALNLNMLQVQGRSDLFLRLEIIKKMLAVPVIVVGVLFGIKVMILGMLVNTIIAFNLNSYWSGKLISYSTARQIKDILPSFFLAAFMGIVVFSIGYFLNISNLFLLLIQIVVGISLTVGIAELIRLDDYLYMKEITLDFILKRK